MNRRRIVAVLATLVVLAGGVAVAAITTIDGPATVGVRAERVPPADTGGVPLPPEARPVDTSHPDHVIGTGTPASCTSAAVVAAVAAGGVITFDCGPDPMTITMAKTAKVVNTSPKVVVDGGGLVTLSGAGQRRILYMNTCDPAQIWTTSHCQNQDQPVLTLQGLTFAGGDSTGDTTEGGGGGAVFVRGGRVKVVESTFVDNRCDASGPDLGGAALRVLSQYDGLPVVVATSTFRDNVCSNGAGISSIGVSWRIYNSVFEHNQAIGSGANPARGGTPGGGSGGAIYLDGNEFTLDVIGTSIRNNSANEGGGAIFFVSNNRTGELRIDRSTLEQNPSRGFETSGYPGIFFLGRGCATGHELDDPLSSSSGSGRVRIIFSDAVPTRLTMVPTSTKPCRRYRRTAGLSDLTESTMRGTPAWSATVATCCRSSVPTPWPITSGSTAIASSGVWSSTNVTRSVSPSPNRRNHAAPTRRPACVAITPRPHRAPSRSGTERDQGHGGSTRSWPLAVRRRVPRGTTSTT